MKFNKDAMPDIEVTQDELKQLVALAGVMAIGIHYGVDPNVPTDDLPEDIEEKGGMLGLMMNTIRASELAGDLLAEIIERAEQNQQKKVDDAFNAIVSQPEGN